MEDLLFHDLLPWLTSNYTVKEKLIGRKGNKSCQEMTGTTKMLDRFYRKNKVFFSAVGRVLSSFHRADVCFKSECLFSFVHSFLIGLALNPFHLFPKLVFHTNLTMAPLVAKSGMGWDV